MSHWIVKVKVNSQETYSHYESDELPSCNNPAAPHIISVEAGPCDTAEAAWIDWHKKVGNL